jgi:hypothetical protein
VAGIKISLFADVKSFLTGAKQSEDALEDVSDSLDDVARDASKAGDKAGDELADGIEAGTDDASDSVERLERSFKELADSVKKESKDAGDKIGANTRKGYDEASRAAKSYESDAEHAGKRAEETTEEFKDEARANFSEVASSFSGDMSSATDLVQGTLGGLAGSIPGGVGLALGGLAAVGGAFAQAWQQAAEDTKERIGDMYDDMVESGNAFLSESLIQQNIRKVMLDEAGRVTDYADAVDIAKESGLDLAVVLRALAGDQAANRVVQEQLTQAVEDGEKKFDAARESGEDYNEVLEDTDGINGHIELLQKQQTEFDKSSDKATAARDATTDYQDTLAGLPPEIRTDLGLVRDIANEQDARATYDGLGRPITTTVKLVPDATAIDKELDRARTLAVTLGVSRAGAAVPI